MTIKKYIKAKAFFFLLLGVILSALIIQASPDRDDIIIPVDEFRTQAGYLNEEGALVIDYGVEVPVFTKSFPMILNKGSYVATIYYQADGAGNSVIYDNNGVLSEKIDMPESGGSLEIPFILDRDSQSVRFLYNYSGDGTLRIYDVNVKCNGRFYSDAFLSVFILWVIIICLYILSVIEWNDEKRKDMLVHLGIICIGLVAFIPYLGGVIELGDDLSYHLMRIEGIKDGLRDGQFPVYVFPEALEGNGYLNCMYPSLFLYIPALIRMTGVSLITSYKCMVFICNIATAYIMYYAVRQLGLKDRSLALLAAGMYTISPYRLCNIYARGAVGELLATTFFPLLVAALYNVMIGNREKWRMLCLSVICIMQSHITSMIFAGILCFVALCVFIKRVIAEKRYKEIMLSVIWFGILDIWFFIPFLMFYLRGSLWLSSLDWSGYEEYAINLTTLLKTVDLQNWRIYSLGLPIVICGVIALISGIIKKDRDDRDRFIWAMILTGIIFTYLATDYFSAWEAMKNPAIAFVISKVQFPFRMLTVPGCVFIMAGVIYIGTGVEWKEWKKAVICILACISVLSILKSTETKVYIDENATHSEVHQKKVMPIRAERLTSL